jgi:vacuolar-type H+-ATPase subunit D/Vma8
MMSQHQGREDIGKRAQLQGELVSVAAEAEDLEEMIERHRMDVEDELRQASVIKIF